MLTAGEAAARIASALSPLEPEFRRLSDAAGRVLAEPIRMDRDQPPFDRVAMDGIALDSAAVAAGRRRFRIQGVQGAGAAPLKLSDTASCIEVMTGAMLPQAADAVVPVEDITVADGAAELAPGAAPKAFVHVHRRGSDGRAGDIVLKAGTVLEGPELAVVAAAGHAKVRVARQPSVMVVSTGDELVELGQSLMPWQIRRSNAYGVAGLLRRRGYAAVADDHLGDDPELMRRRLAQHLETHDVLVLSGGVSAGRFDHVPGVLADLGVEVVFHRVAQRPGKPLWFGTTATGRAVFGLPGRPVSTLVCLVRYVLPALLRLQGAEGAAPPVLPLDIRQDAARTMTLFLPVDLERGPEGSSRAVARPNHGSEDFVALAGTAGFVELAPGPAWELGRPAPFYHW
jgi:molybdopterin molybdotransferase